MTPLRRRDQGIFCAMISLEILGDRAWLASFRTEDEARHWSEAVREVVDPAIEEVVLAYRSVGVVASLGSKDLDQLESRLKTVRVPKRKDRQAGRVHRVPVLYDGEDLQEVADQAQCRAEDVVAIHSATSYQVYAIGFQPGFPYLGYLKPPLDRVVRRPTPRTRVPAGSVAIAARQTGIYPTSLPGGWQLLGRTPLIIADLDSGFFPIAAGDEVRFFPIDAAEFARRQAEKL